MRIPSAKRHFMHFWGENAFEESDFSVCLRDNDHKMTCYTALKRVNGTNAVTNNTENNRLHK